MASDVKIKNVDNFKAPVYEAMIKEYKSINETEKGVLLKAYAELEILQDKIEKIQSNKNLTKNQKKEIENLITQMEAVYDRIEPIETKVMDELYGADFKGEQIADEGDFEYSKEATRDYVNSLDVLNAEEKVKMINAYDKIEELFDKFDSLNKEQQDSKVGVALLDEVGALIDSVSELEDKVESGSFNIYELGAQYKTLEEAIECVNTLKLNSKAKEELKAIYTNILNKYGQLDKLYNELGDGEVTEEYLEKDEQISNEINDLFVKLANFNK